MSRNVKSVFDVNGIVFGGKPVTCFVLWSLGFQVLS